MQAPTQASFRYQRACALAHLQVRSIAGAQITNKASSSAYTSITIQTLTPSPTHKRMPNHTPLRNSHDHHCHASYFHHIPGQGKKPSHLCSPWFKAFRPPTIPLLGRRISITWPTSQLHASRCGLWLLEHSSNTQHRIPNQQQCACKHVHFTNGYAS